MYTNSNLLKFILMSTLRKIFLVLFCLGIPCVSMAQNVILEIEKRLNYRQPVTPVKLENHLYSSFYKSGKSVYNLKGFEISNTSMPIMSLKINPAGNSYAVLSGKGVKREVQIFDIYSVDKVIHEFEEQATAIAYSPDSRVLYISTENSVINAYNTKSFQLQLQINSPLVPSELVVSPNGFILVAHSDNEIVIIDPHTGGVRTTISTGAKINSVAFSDDAAMMGVLVADGTLDIYDTHTFNPIANIDTLGNAASFSFHPDNKYVAVITDDNIITFVNIFEPFSRGILVEPDGSLGDVCFLRDGKKNLYLTFSSEKSIKYEIFKGLSPNYTMLLHKELAARLESWSKMQEGESFDDYKIRVTEENRQKQARLFEQEIATEMADNLVMSSSISLGGYNVDKGTLTLEFDNMPPIYLSVPQEEVQDFMSSENLEFRDAVYGVSKEDKFELIYASVYNKATGKSYEFDNLNRESLDFLTAGADFVPIELVQQSSMEEVKLNAVKKDIVEKAKEQGFISNHTNIFVSTGVATETDGMGNKHTNYKVGFNYEVEQGFSVAEDFPAGEYVISKSHAAESMLKIVEQAFNGDFAQYIVSGKKVIINITGSADAIPVRRTIPYDGIFGNYVGEPYYCDGDLSNITVTSSTGIKTNEQLAFVRGTAVKDFVERALPALGSMDIMYNYYIDLSDKTGSAYRRISVEFIFVDAF